MLDENEKNEAGTEEAKQPQAAEEAKASEETLDKTIKEGEDSQKDEISDEVLEAHTEFDKKADEPEPGEEEDSAANEDKVNDSEKKPEEEAKVEVVDEKSDELKEKTEGKPEEKPAQIDTGILVRAGAVGLSPEEVGGFTNAEDLQRTISILEAKKAAEKGSDEEDEDKPFDSGLSKDDYEPELVDAVNKMGEDNRQLRKQIEDINENNKVTAKASEQAATKEYTKWFDKKIEDLGENFEDVFGKGDYDAAKKGTTEFTNRGKVLDQMEIIAAGHKSMGKAYPSEDELFKMALGHVFGDKIEKNATTVTTEKIKERNKQIIGSGSKQTTATTGMEKAIEQQKNFDDKLDEDD